MLYDIYINKKTNGANRSNEVQHPSGTKRDSHPVSNGDQVQFHNGLNGDAIVILWGTDFFLRDGTAPAGMELLGSRARAIVIPGNQSSAVFVASKPSPGSCKFSVSVDARDADGSIGIMSIPDPGDVPDEFKARIKGQDPEIIIG